KTLAISASGCGEIKVSAPKEGLRKGDVFEIPLSVDSASGVMGLSFILGFSPEAIEFVSATKGELLTRNGGEAVFLVKNDSGRIKMDIAILGGSPLGISGSGILANLKFKMLSDELGTGIEITNSDVRSLQNTPVSLPAQDEEKIPGQSSLLQSFPNPMGDGCWIPFKLSADSNQLSVEIYNVVGQRVKNINAGPRKAGSYTKGEEGYAIFWNRTNDVGEKVSKGLYFYKLSAGKFSDVRSLVVE
ncbi:MAG: cohesin domain-containing protein, partial [Candidatus Desantisbacteria bacterium]